VKRISEDGQRLKQSCAAVRVVYGILWHRGIRKKDDIYIGVYLKLKQLSNTETDSVSTD
jgi:hypothetical protein